MIANNTNGIEEPEMVAELTHGQRVSDRESADNEEMVVLRIRALTTAREYQIDTIGQTVAQKNPEYPASDPVVEVASVEDIEDVLGDDWEADDVVELFQSGQCGRTRINHDVYPVSRLAHDGET